jgi:hypothetical protein
MNLFQLFKLLDKYAQQTQQQELGDAEATALQKTVAWTKIQAFLQPKVVSILGTPPAKIALSQINVDVSFGIILTIGPTKNATAADFSKVDIYYSNNNVSEMEALNHQVKTQFGNLLAQNMLKMYQTDPGCKNVLKIDAQPNSKYYVKIKVKLN